MEPLSLVGTALALGMLGFIEPCTVGSHLLFVKHLEDRTGRSKVAQTVVFTLTRALVIGGLGAVAALVGERFLGLQRGFWLLLGSLYLLLGITYLLGRQGVLLRTLGVQVRRSDASQESALLGVLFGLNVPACAAPLLAAVLGASVGSASVGLGFGTLALFGLALSAPLLLAVLWGDARQWLERFANLSERMPFWTGVVFVALGVWTIAWAV